MFGTFDDRRHPRVRVLAEGLAELGAEVVTCNEPWDAPTDARVAALRSPRIALRLAGRLLRSWARLVRSARRVGPVDVVVVGYLGVFDVHLARLCWPRATLVLDHLAPAGGTVSDRAGGRIAGRLARVLDGWAVHRADVVVVDTDEHRDSVVDTLSVVVPVGAPQNWFTAPQPRTDGPLRVVFFGLHTPLQGTPAIGRALRLALQEHADLQITMVGTGQDLQACQQELRDRDEVTWRAWVDGDELIDLVAAHDVCLGIFGTTPKAHRVVPNKVFQGAAAGCVVITSDTPPQRRALEADAVYVPAGDAPRLAETLVLLAADPARVERLRTSSYARAEHAFRPGMVVTPLVEHLRAEHRRG